MKIFEKNKPFILFILMFLFPAQAILVAEKLIIIMNLNRVKLL